MKYISNEEYTNSLIPANEIEEYIELASINVNKACHTRIEKIGFNNLNDSQKEYIKKAVIKEMDDLYSNADYDDVGSFSIGDVSISNASKKGYVCKSSMRYLELTGLTSKCL